MSVLETKSEGVAYHVEYSGEKLPVWLRLLTIIGLSAGLWGAIIWAIVAIFFVG